MADNEHDNPTPMTPAAEQVAVQAVSRMAADGYTSSVMKLPRPAINELGRRLLTPGLTTDQAAIEWLESEGHHLPKSNVYRWVQRFREVVKIVLRDWGNQLLDHELAHDPRYDDESLRSRQKSRWNQLITQYVLMAGPEQIDAKMIGAMAKWFRANEQTELDREKLELDREQAEQRAATAEAQRDKLKADTEAKRARINEALKALRARLDDAEKIVKSGRAIDPAVFAAIRDELVQLADREDAA